MYVLFPIYLHFESKAEGNGTGEKTVLSIIFTGTGLYAKKPKRISADWGTETAQLELFSKLTTVC